jgi:hypothetical protein
MRTALNELQAAAAASVPSRPITASDVARISPRPDPGLIAKALLACGRTCDDSGLRDATQIVDSLMTQTGDPVCIVDDLGNAIRVLPGIGDSMRALWLARFAAARARFADGGPHSRLQMRALVSGLWLAARPLPQAS